MKEQRKIFFLLKVSPNNLNSIEIRISIGTCNPFICRINVKSRVHTSSMHTCTVLHSGARVLYCCSPRALRSTLMCQSFWNLHFSSLYHIHMDEIFGVTKYVLCVMYEYIWWFGLCLVSYLESGEFSVKKSE